MAGTSATLVTMRVPNGRNTPSSMPSATGSGISAVSRWMEPDRPRSARAPDATMQAPIASAKLIWVRAAGSRVAPAMVQRTVMGCR